MPAATTDRNTRRRGSDVRTLPVAANTVIPAGVIAAVNAVAIPAANGSNQSAIDTARANRVRTAILFSMVAPEYLVQR